MKFEFKPSFDKSVKNLSSKNKKKIKELCFSLIDVLSGQSLFLEVLGSRI